MYGMGVTAAVVVVAFFHRGGNCRLPQHRRDGFSLITSGHGETLCYNELSQMGLVIFQWGFNSGACLKIPELGFYCGVLLFEYV